MIDIEAISTNLSLGNEGYWLSNQQSRISYPEIGNAMCHQFEEKSFWFQHRNRCILELLKAFPPSGTLLDVGGGNGFVSRALLDAGFDVILLEPGAIGARNAIQRGLPAVICSTLDDAGFKEQVLPAVGAFDIIEHIKDSRAFLETIRKVLLPGGRLYITTPAYQLLWSEDDVFAGHYRRYTIASLTELLKAAGFINLYSTYIFSILPVPIFLRRTLTSRLGARKSQAIDQQDQERQHSLPASAWTRKLVDGMFGWECVRISRLSSIPFGSSCLVVAQPAAAHEKP